MEIKAVIFDIGGVIVRTEDWTPRRQLEQQYGLGEWEAHDLVFESEVARLATEGQVPESQVWEYLTERLNLDASSLAAFQEQFWAGDRIDDQLVDYIRRLQPTYRTALLSNAWSEARQLLSEKYNLDQLTEMLIISAEEKMAKPDPRIYGLALERLGLAPAESVFVDDKLANIEAARAFGMQAVHFQSTAQLFNDLAELGVVPAQDSKSQ